MTWVKICGMTNLEDALTAVEAGADAVGFVFYEKSPRNVTVETAREIVRELPEGVEKIGVFVAGVGPEPHEVVLQAGLTGIQSYLPFESGGGSGSATVTGRGVFPEHARFLMALSMKFFEEDHAVQQLASSLAHLRSLPGDVSPPEGWMDTVVLDSGDLRMPGGTGRSFDWEKAVPIAEGMRRGSVKLVVAGGLTAENVGEAIRILQPWGVDVSSGVEARPGKKDAEKVRAFVRAVRAAG
jgi:phosphoribosylanthranilate isomerase